MIEINLLPEEVKTTPKKAGIGVKFEDIYKYIPLIFGIIIFLHICLSAFSIFKNRQFKTLNNKWKAQEPQRKTLEGFKKEFEVLLANEKAIKQMNASRLNWAEKLNKLSLNLPYGIWFNDVSISKNDFVLAGSVVSLQKEEVNLLNKFIDNLKKDAAFFKDFNNLELSSVQRKMIVSYDVADFILKGKLKETSEKAPVTPKKSIRQ